MAVQDNQIKAVINEYFFKNRADFEAHKDEILNNSNFYIEDDGLGVVTMQTKVLWENSSPSNAFAAQEVTVNGLNDYQYILIKFYGDTGLLIYFLQLFEVNKNSRLFYVGVNGSQTGQRDFTFSTNKITFNDAKWNGNTSNEDIIPYQIIGIKLIESPTQITNKYSTEETVIGEWIDGKKIYRKVYYNVPISTSSQAIVLADIDLTSLSIDTIVGQKTYFYTSTISLRTPVTTQSYQLYYYIENNHYQFAGINTIGSGKIQIILEYTKTTD